MSMALVIDGLSIVDANGTSLVTDLSFSVEHGSVLGLVGESGSGKTLTALAIMGLLPTEVRVCGGSIKVDGSSNWKMYDHSNKEVKSGTGNNGDIEHIENFLNAIRNDTPLALNAEIQIGHTSTMLCHLGNIAQRTGRTLNINPKNGHIVGDDAAMKYWQRDYADGWAEDLTIT